MKEKRESRLYAGATSILVILITFLLTAFAAQSIKVSNNELNLAKRTRKSAQNYYEADSEAEQILMQISLVLENYYNDISGVALKVQLQELVEGKGMVEAKTDKEGQISYYIKIDKNASLNVVVNYNVEVGMNKKYNVIRWKVRSAGN